jgi:hypothetical protein
VLNTICFAFDTCFLSLLVLSDFILSFSSVACITLYSYAVHVLSATGPWAVESAHKLDFNLEAFATTELSDIFSGRQQRQDVKFSRRFKK